MRAVGVDHLYREHAPAIIASLVRSFGPTRLDLVETAVQEAFVAALEQWGETPPDRPAAWLQTTARRRVIDALRRAAWFAPDEPEEPAAPEPARTGDDDLLRMMLVCCHPSLPLEAQLVLALRTLCGLPVSALARALLADEAAIEKRLVRARQTLRDAKVELEVDDAPARVEAVLRMLYVLYFEGYSAHAGASQIDDDLCRTAIRLNELLVTGFARPSAHALQALFLLQTSRFAARIDEHGEIVPLHLQDRARWDRAAIERGLFHLARAASGDVVSPYHLEAAIAACHALAPTYDATDWARIVALYDQLVAIAPSPVVALQRAIAVGRAAGPRVGLRALESIGDARLEDSAVLAAATAELEAELGNVRAAKAAYRRALELAGTEPERRFLEKKLYGLGKA
jgi:RNA polymerase sigma factor (sigma-70 family)